jgi:regulator of telomere elongation helicase 1
VVAELKNTSYRPKTTILGSRSQLCINPQVSSAKGEAQNQLCRSKVNSKSCEYHKGFQENEWESKDIADIEDLIKLGNEHTSCPYYMAREMQKDAGLSSYCPNLSQISFLHRIIT